VTLRRLKNYLIEWNRSAKEIVDDVWVVVDLLVDHEGKDTHLGSTTVVKLNCRFLGDSGSIPLGGGKLGGLDLIFAGSESDFDEADGKNNFEDSVDRKCVEHGKTGLHFRIRDSTFLDSGVTRQSPTVSGGDVSKNRQHGNSAVLNFNSAKAIESFLISVVKETERIPETKWGLCTKLAGERHLQSRRGNAAGRRSKCSSSDERGKKARQHWFHRC